MSDSSASNRWVPFHCPVCSGIFRLRRNQVGRCGHCPSCDAVIRTSGEVVSHKRPSAENGADESLLDRISVARTMTPEEVAEKKEKLESWKRQQAAAVADTIEWEADGEEPTKTGPSLHLIWSGVMALVLLLALGVFYVKEMTGGKRANQSSDGKVVVGESESLAILDEILNKDLTENFENADGIDPAAEIKRRQQEFKMDEIQERVSSFLSSETVSDRLKYVRDSERVAPLMVSHYGGEQIDAEGFREMAKDPVGLGKGFVITSVQTADFITNQIAIERVATGEEVEYLVDWESWVGFCDLSADELRATKPTDPQLVRVLVSASNYYNYEFSDESKWACYKLELKDEDLTFLGYTERGSEVDHAFLDLKKRTTGELALRKGLYALKVAYLPNASSLDQVEILEIVSSSWVVRSKNENNNE